MDDSWFYLYFTGGNIGRPVILIPIKGDYGEKLLYVVYCDYIVCSRFIQIYDKESYEYFKAYGILSECLTLYALHHTDPKGDLSSKYSAIIIWPLLSKDVVRLLKL